MTKYIKARTPSGTRVHILVSDGYWQGYKHTKALCGHSNYYGTYLGEGYSPCANCLMRAGITSLDALFEDDREEEVDINDKARTIWYQELILQEIENLPRHMYTETGWMGSIQYSVGRQGVGLAEIINIITKDRG